MCEAGSRRRAKMATQIESVHMRSQFLSFDKLIGSRLIVIICWLGLIGIGLGVIAGASGGLASMR